MSKMLPTLTFASSFYGFSSFTCAAASSLDATVEAESDSDLTQ